VDRKKENQNLKDEIKEIRDYRDPRRHIADCKLVVRKIQGFEFETISKCNICGNTQTLILSNMDRYGINIRTAICPVCGLVYLANRLTQDGYKKFYEEGIYREMISAYKGKGQTNQIILRAQETHASSLANSLSKLLVFSKREKELLDIGGSNGLISKELERTLGYKVTLLEPAVKEAELARERGLTVEVGSIETWTTDRKFDLILLSKTFEHLYDIRLAFKRIYNMLTPDGVFFCDISDFFKMWEKKGSVQRVTKIDHCFWISDHYASQFFARVGFQIIGKINDLPREAEAYLLKPFKESPSLSSVNAFVIQEVEKCQAFEELWNTIVKEYYSLPNRIKRILVKLKKKLISIR